MPKAFASVAEYLKALPPERRAVIAATRKLVDHLEVVDVDTFLLDGCRAGRH